MKYLYLNFDNPELSDITHDWCIVKCPDYCESGLQIAYWDGRGWLNDIGDDISNYVSEWIVLG